MRPVGQLSVFSNKSRSRAHFRSLIRFRSILVALLVLSFASLGLSDDRTILHPGYNLFSPQQDIEFGQRASAQVPQQFLLLSDKRVNDYLQQLGLKLATHAPGYKYPYQYRCINSEVINAFALPGGFVYINRGVIENADDEAQLAAVMAHETSHVALRHGTSQATKVYAAQAGLSIVGALLGNNAAASFAAQLFGGVGVPLVFLKMSRTDESQADILGTQILHDAGYDPMAMGQFFKKLEAENDGEAVAFFSDHPSPVNRVARTDDEANRLSIMKHPKEDSPEFEAIKRYVHSLPPPPKANARETGAAAGNTANEPALPSVQYVAYSNSEVNLMRPDNWQPQAASGSVSLVPDRGMITDGQGNSTMAYGVVVGVYSPEKVSGNAPNLDEATEQFLDSLNKSNQKMSIIRKPEATTLGGQPALSTYLESDSPAGGREADWVVTSLRPGGLFYIISVAPQKDYGDYGGAFRSVVHSVTFPN
jgi:Zn-dependent protease with chaperone function